MPITTFRTLRPLVGNHGRKIALIIVLGTVSSIAEGIGITFFLPLLQSSEPVGANHFLYAGWLARINSWAPGSAGSGTRLAAICTLILALLLLKAALGYITSILSSCANATIGHDLRSRTFHQLLSVCYSFLDKNE